MYVAVICIKFLLQACLHKVGEVSRWVMKLIALCKFEIGETGRERVKGSKGKSEGRANIPLSVNYHFTRQCNYKCGFCFHTAKTSFVLPLEEAKKGLKLLKAAGMEKINFSGGEPFLHDRGEFLGKLVQYCKRELNLPSVSVVSNGSRITEKWFKSYGEDLDILAISCDSFDEETNRLIGRGQGKKSHIENLHKVRLWCKDYKVAFKINSVINRFNIEEDMTEQIRSLDPVRWKVFQCLLIDGENAGEQALRHAETFIISNEDFQRFLDRHKDIKCLVPESNEKMRDSYLILDEYAGQGMAPTIGQIQTQEQVLLAHRLLLTCRLGWLIITPCPAYFLLCNGGSGHE
ncbi:radical S-adenosyl methionine domain-containing protein 2 isoform X2 [Pristis pectinata]|uniref:radical S-adenosyl methionine domain-containing protein 2 isoform X2 n=1 Tax=Pristis pectinata TaxID=685728 RepID=UPI00223D64E2|nr:radical S-adenosyl methionine domain-containing protein 2 isoform X2 [Pristis pectinata]